MLGAALLTGCLSGSVDTGSAWQQRPEWWSPMAGGGDGLPGTVWQDDRGACLWVGANRISYDGHEVDAHCGEGPGPFGLSPYSACDLPSGERWVWMTDEPFSVEGPAVVLMPDEDVPMVRGCRWLPSLD